MFKVIENIKELKIFISDKFKDTKDITNDNIGELRNKVNRLEKMIKNKIKK